ncbi:MAG: endonuclease III [Bacteroidetes bacterium]|nr:endonuclease III [Bacteroidota bacterium]
MTVLEKAEFVRDFLEKQYPDPPIPLDHSSPFTLLIAVLLSAQCTDERVNKVTPALFALADHPAAMAKLDIATIEEIIRPCGLSANKSKAIHRLSEMLVADYQGIVPADIVELEKLPGVGHKTASVVMIQSFGVPAFPVDTHIHRLANRWGLSEGKTVEQIEKDLKVLFPEESWAKLHLQIIYFGRQFCKAKGHVPNDCPICAVVGLES